MQQKQSRTGCVHLKNTTKVSNQQINQVTEIFIKNVVLDDVRKILETYYTEKELENFMKLKTQKI